MKTARLGSVAIIDRQSIQPENIGSGTLYVGLENIESGGRFVNVKQVDCGDLASSKFKFTSRHLLYGKLRPYLAKIALPSFDGICSTDILPILPSRELDVRYLKHYLSQQRMVDIANSLATGANLPRLSPKSLESFEIPLPPLSEQKRIATILDKADEIRKKRELAIQKLDQLVKSVFIEMFGDPFTNQANFVRLGSVALITMGQSPDGESYNYDSVGTPLLNGPTEFGDEFPTAKQWTTSPTKFCRDDDVLFCVRGATAGRLNRANGTYCIGRGLAAIRSKPNSAVNSEFLYTLLGQYYTYFQTKGVGSTFINISKDDLESLPIPAATDSLVTDFQTRISKVRAVIAREKEFHKKSVAIQNSLQSGFFS